MEESRPDDERLGGIALPILTDVSDDLQVEAAAVQAEQEFCPIDIWINNAMVSVLSPAADYRQMDPGRANNLYNTLPGDYGARGRFDDRSTDYSVQAWANRYCRLASSGRAQPRGRIFVLSDDQEVSMKSIPIFRFLILVIPLVWVSIRLMPMEQQVLAEVRLVESQEPIVRMTEQEKELLDKFVKHESRFKDHYRSHFSTSNYEYHQYRPAYQHGFELGLDARYRKMDWSNVEPEARRTWDESTMGLWNQYKDAVRYGWEQAVALERK